MLLLVTSLLDNRTGIDSELIIFEVANQLLPNWFYFIVLTGIAAAVMSSADSFLLAAATSIANDIQAKQIEQKYRFGSLTMSRIFLVGLGCLAAILAFNTNIESNNAVVFRLASYAWEG